MQGLGVKDNIAYSVRAGTVCTSCIYHAFDEVPGAFH